jgi:flagellar assembly factor FliW
MLDENETLLCNKTLLNNTILEKISNKCYVNVECFCLISMKNPFDDTTAPIENSMNNFNGMVIIGCGNSIIFQTAVDHTKIQIPDSYGTVKTVCNLDDYV